MLSAGLVAAIPFDRESAVPYYAQIYNGFRTGILTGRLGPGERLPSTRSLATELAISRLPVLMAFQQLLSEGYLVGKVGSGTYVADPLPNVIRARVPWWQPAHQHVIAHARPTATERPSVGGAQGVFRIGLPALDRFPHEMFARVVRRHAADRNVDLLGYGDPSGHLPLRDAIAKYLRSARAVNCDAGQVLIVSGSQMALQIAAIALVTPELGRLRRRSGLPIRSTHHCAIARHNRPDRGGRDGHRCLNPGQAWHASEDGICHSVASVPPWSRNDGVPQTCAS